ncbi:hypothetical protein C8N24_3692 [Solirubrobacter pauli]|uniref:Uncharacterized protein n=1 Tax=Solirubrobacter pauli TaxID=166793 RepID=A0A660LFC9_9ACTN|nr:hypothetical protein [Solirubrobacter pauli]RKQ93818.1 hypothetical protein C8N24_3692 [Solirubrobacter pauli]
MDTDSERWRPAPWAAAALLGAAATGTLAYRQRARSPLVAAAAVLAGQVIAYANARRAIQHALGIGPGRRTFEQERARAFRDLLLDDGTHTPSFGAAEAALERLQAGPMAADAARRIASARAGINALERQLFETRAQRESDKDVDQQRRLGGFAPHAPSRAGDPLALYGVRPRLPARVPAELGDVIEQVGLVLDEVRLLHTAEIEWSTLLFTLWARAAIVGLAPALSNATAAPVDLRHPGGMAWAAAAAIATATATAGPRVADAAMDRGAAGRRVRHALLRVEVPATCVLLYTQPSWMSGVFAGGWTNWAQRPDFSWRRLATFVGVVTTVQSVGLTRRGVSFPRTAAEVAAGLAAVFYTGSSYGAILPLSASTAAQVIASGTLPVRAVREARERMLDVAGTLREAVAGLELDADVTTVVEAAAVLEANADAIEQPPDVLFELVETAFRHSDVPLGDTDAAATRARDAELAGEPAPVELRTPLFGDVEGLRTAVVRSAKDARTLHNLLVVLIREAEVHGTMRAYVALDVVGDRLVLRVANERRPVPRRGRRGSGGARIERLARQLPQGRLDRRENTDGAFVGLRPRPGWFGVEVSCSAAVLSGFPDHVRGD